MGLLAKTNVVAGSRKGLHFFKNAANPGQVTKAGLCLRQQCLHGRPVARPLLLPSWPPPAQRAVVVEQRDFDAFWRGYRKLQQSDKNSGNQIKLFGKRLHQIGRRVTTVRIPLPVAAGAHPGAHDIVSQFGSVHGVGRAFTDLTVVEDGSSPTTLANNVMHERNFMSSG